MNAKQEIAKSARQRVLTDSLGQVERRYGITHLALSDGTACPLCGACV